MSPSDSHRVCHQFWATVDLNGIRHGNDVGVTELTAAQVAQKLATEYAEDRRVTADRIAINVRLGAPVE